MCVVANKKHRDCVPRLGWDWTGHGYESGCCYEILQREEEAANIDIVCVGVPSFCSAYVRGVCAMRVAAKSWSEAGDCVSKERMREGGS